MLFGPCFAVGAFIFAHHQYGHVGLARRIDCRLNRRCLRLRIDKLDVVRPPAQVALRRRRDLAALCVEHRRFAAHACTNAIQNAHSLAGIACVSAQVNVGRIGSNHGNGLQLR